MAPPRWGWHRLAADHADRLVADAGLGPGDLVLDVGAGTGALTGPLVATGARVVAVERHPGRRAALRREFGGVVVVVGADAEDLRLPRRPFHVVANPPFAVTTGLLRRLLHPGSRLLTARLVLPDHAVRRWTSPGAPGVGRWGATFALRRGHRVPRAAFSPAAPVSCRVLVVERHGSSRQGRGRRSRL